MHYSNARHAAIASILRGLDAKLLQENFCYFAGGTAISMSHGEYRESVDIDFLVSSGAGYSNLRNICKSQGFEGLFENPLSIHSGSTPRIDQYGIRGMVRAGNHQIKFEIVLEARLDLEEFLPASLIEGVATLSTAGLVAEKLLANSDRYLDDGVLSRDIIDLAYIGGANKDFQAGLAAARSAYGAPVIQDALKAVSLLLERKGRMAHCLEALGMTDSKAAMTKRLLELQKKLLRLAS